MLEVIIYSKDHCPLCDDAVHLLEEMQVEESFNLTVIDIYKDDALLEKYQLMIPVVVINGEEIDYGQISREKVRRHIV
ncbi:glutaredoxin family protein [bacterium LRH843]|nr:glutaredoxin family protein [bacterium LRH843]